MLTPAEILALVTATGKAVNIFDKISGQIKSVLLRRPKEDEGDEERWRHKIKTKGTEITVRQDKKKIQTITADDLKKLPKKHVRHIETYEEAMERHYKVWRAIYKQKDASPDPRVNALVDQQLVDQIKIMQRELTAIIDFLRTLGLYLDDHYMEVRNLVDQLAHED